MRRQIRAVALATAALLAITGFASAQASASPQPLLTPAAKSTVAAAAVPAKKHPKPTKKHPKPSAQRMAREAALARGNRQAADLVGYMPSLYQGKWYMPKKEQRRRCIVMRESHANYRVVGAGTYFGAYQMSRSLAIGATWIMQKEVKKEMGKEGVRIVRALRKTNPNTWNRYWQDRAFWTIWRHGAGSGHWGGGAHSC